MGDHGARPVRARGPGGGTPGSSGAPSRSRPSACARRSRAARARRSARSRTGPRCRTASSAPVWCGPPAISQASAEVARSGFGLHTARATGSRGSGSSGSTISTSLAIIRKRSPRSRIAALSAGPGGAVKTSRTGSSRPPIESGWISHDGTPAGDRRAHLEHVRAEDPLLAGGEVVGVVLHERRPAGKPLPHGLHHAHERRRLPVAFSAEAVAVGHQPLDGDPGKLPQAVQVLEGVGERARAERVEQPAQAGLDPRRVAEGRRAASPSGAKRGDEVVGGLDTRRPAGRPRRPDTAFTDSTRSPTP